MIIKELSPRPAPRPASSRRRGRAFPDLVVAAGPREEALGLAVPSLETFCEARQADGPSAAPRAAAVRRPHAAGAAVARSLQEVYDDVEIVHLLTDAKAERTVTEDVAGSRAQLRELIRGGGGGVTRAAATRIERPIDRV